MKEKCKNALKVEQVCEMGVFPHGVCSLRTFLSVNVIQMGNCSDECIFTQSLEGAGLGMVTWSVSQHRHLCLRLNFA